MQALVSTLPRPRPLGPNEKAFWKLSESSSLNIAILIHIRPHLDAGRVRDALASLQLRHPLLRARIELRNGRPWFEWPAEVPPIPFEVRALPRSEWTAAVVADLRRPFVWKDAPLARAFLFTDGDHDGFILSFHHAITDGKAAFAAIRDVLWEATLGAPRSPLVHERSVAAESALPRTSRGLRGVWRRLKVMARFAGDARRHPDPLTFPVKRTAAPHERTFHVEERLFDAALTTAISARARTAGATVQGALGAAVLFSIARAAKVQGARTVTFGSPINVRDRLSPPAGDQIGMFLGVSAYRGSIAPSTRFWDLARDIRARISEDLETGRALDALPLMELFYRSLGGDRISAQEFGRKWAATNGTTGITNVGKIDIEAPTGYTIDRVVPVAFPSGLDVFNAIASSYNGCLQMHFNWPEPCTDHASVRAVVDDFEAILRAAVDGDPTLASP